MDSFKVNFISACCGIRGAVDFLAESLLAVTV